ncbi:MAG: hypothetical protein JSW60_06695 [Thermoplasmatales archaeon]|nr:MAG: hypothetical protein JSW60_06695 [Thermoplasmatales archaeon]
MHETTEERVQRGLETLARDIRNLFRKKEQSTQSMENGTQGEYKPVYQNIINNYTNGTQIPLQSVRFGFIRTTAIVVFMVGISAITWLLITNPQALVDMWNQFVQFMHSI